MSDPPPGPGLAADEQTAFDDFARMVPLAAGTFVEIGGEFPSARLKHAGVARWTSIDPAAVPGRSGIRESVQACAEAMPVAGASADAIFSSNALQFVPFAAVLAEARRVLRPGGVLFAHFGPIWSGIDGHQLEYVRHAGQDLVFWRDTLLPPWAHLAYEPEELRALLRSGMETDLADLLVQHVHESSTINRLFFEDYVDAALASGLEWIDVTASDALDYEIRPPTLDRALERRLSPEELRARVSAHRGKPTRIGIRDVRIVLRRAHDDINEGAAA